MYRLIAIPFLFLLIFFIPYSEAYTIFNTNPYFDSGINGILAYNDPFNLTYQYNDTCYGKTGCFQSISNNYTNVNLYLTSQNSFITINPVYLNFSWYESETFLTLPANQEGVVALSYYSNYTLYGYLGQQATPYLFIIQRNPSYLVINSTAINQGSGLWNNYTVVIPAMPYSRQIVVEMGYSTYTNPTIVSIDKFKFYTYDATEIRYSWDSDLSVEKIRYCGTNTTDNTIFEPSSDYNQSYFADVGINNTAYLMANGEDGMECHVFKLGDITIARRVSSREGDPYGGSTCGYFKPYILYSYHDPMYLISTTTRDCCQSDQNLASRFLIQKLSLTSALVTSFKDFYPVNFTRLLTDVGIKINLSNSTDGCFQNLSNNLFANVNLNPCASSTITGTKWRVSYQNNVSCSPNTYNTSFHDFFTSTLSCSAKYTCDPATNTESYIMPDCITSQYRDCGSCRCKSDLTRCNDAGFQGTVCANTPLNDTFLISIGCTLEAGVCNPYTHCVNNSDGISITCLNNTNSTTGSYVVNSTGGNESYEIPSNESSDISVNPTGWFAAIVGNFFGIKDMIIAREITSIIFSLAVSLGFVSIMIYLGIKGKTLFTVLIFLTVMFLIVFTIIGWFSPLYMIVLIILSGFVVVKSTGLIGG